MLVISRCKDEEIVIGDGQILIHVVEIRGDKVRLGITAPQEIPVHRHEVYNGIKNCELKILLDNKEYQNAYNFLLDYPKYRFSQDVFSRLKKGLEALDGIDDKILKDLDYLKYRIKEGGIF